MSKLTPTSPLLTLIIEPKGDLTVRSVLSQFHPIMKKHGFGHFQMEEGHLYAASRKESVFWGYESVFAESVNGRILINLDGRPYFIGTKKDRLELNEMASEFESLVSCKTTVVGPNYSAVIKSNLLFSGLPIFAGTTLGLVISKVVFDFEIIQFFRLIHLPILAALSSKTRFWMNQRRKERPAWIGIALFFLLPLLLIVGVVGGDFFLGSD